MGESAWRSCSKEIWIKAVVLAAFLLRQNKKNLTISGPFCEFSLMRGYSSSSSIRCCQPGQSSSSDSSTSSESSSRFNSLCKTWYATIALKATSKACATSAGELQSSRCAQVACQAHSAIRFSVGTPSLLHRIVFYGTPPR